MSQCELGVLGKSLHLCDHIIPGGMVKHTKGQGFADSLDNAGRAKHPNGHPVLVELGHGGVEQVGDKLPPGRLPAQLLLLC